jgi:hypothetical protein
MSTKVFKLLTSGISHASLSDVSEKIQSIASERFAADQPQVGPLAVKVKADHTELLKALTRVSCSEYTPVIGTKHGQRIGSLIAFRHLLRSKLSETVKPEIAAIAQQVKAVLVNSGLWRYKNLSHLRMSNFIASMIQVFSIPHYREMLVSLGMAEAFDAMVAWEEQYGTLETQRVKEQVGDTTPLLIVAREQLMQSLNALATCVMVNAQSDPATFGVAAEEIATIVREANAVTRSGKTRKANAAASSQLGDRKTEQAAAHTGGQAQNTTPQQGTTVTSATPDTNPADPPENKGASTA